MIGDAGSTISFLYGAGRKSALCGGSTLSSWRRFGKGLHQTSHIPHATPHRERKAEGGVKNKENPPEEQSTKRSRSRSF